MRTCLALEMLVSPFQCHVNVTFVFYYLDLWDLILPWALRKVINLQYIVVIVVILHYGCLDFLHISLV